MNHVELSLLIIEILMILFALYASETKNIAYSILSLLIISVLAGLAFFILGAIYTSIVQIAVFSGAIVIMFIFVFIMTRGGVPKDESY
ncbi:MAG TPA: NADH-quinone oxidoreductase subunit J [Thermoprotei archaeon]|nr:NADH-quinone oxidoreductase subunit J [Thermoprotei archaeon]